VHQYNSSDTLFLAEVFSVINTDNAMQKSWQRGEWLATLV